MGSGRRSGWCGGQTARSVRNVKWLPQEEKSPGGLTPSADQQIPVPAERKTFPGTGNTPTNLRLSFHSSVLPPF